MCRRQRPTHERHRNFLILRLRHGPRRAPALLLLPQWLLSSLTRVARLQPSGAVTRRQAAALSLKRRCCPVRSAVLLLCCWSSGSCWRGPRRLPLAPRKEGGEVCGFCCAALADRGLVVCWWFSGDSRVPGGGCNAGYDAAPTPHYHASVSCEPAPPPASAPPPALRHRRVCPECCEPPPAGGRPHRVVQDQVGAAALQAGKAGTMSDGLRAPPAQAAGPCPPPWHAHMASRKGLCQAGAGGAALQAAAVPKRRYADRPRLKSERRRRQLRRHPRSSAAMRPGTSCLPSCPLRPAALAWPLSGPPRQRPLRAHLFALQCKRTGT